MNRPRIVIPFNLLGMLILAACLAFWSTVFNIVGAAL